MSVLEEGRLRDPASRLISLAYGNFAERVIRRPLAVPPRPLRVITVGGATLGGSGKTRLALACARELAARGVETVLVGHRYRAAAATEDAWIVPGVAADADAEAEAVARSGDEAVHCARALAGVAHARVVVGRSRQAAIDFAASLDPAPRVLVIDGPLQIRPRRADLALLAVDQDEPWGRAERVVPAGDLRAPIEALVAAADLVVYVDATPRTVACVGNGTEPCPPMPFSSFLSGPAAGRRVGLFTAIARPARLERALLRAGLRLGAVVRLPDHGLSPARGARPSYAERLKNELDSHSVDLWLATEKCALHLPPSARAGAGRALPFAILGSGMELDRSLVSALTELVERPVAGVP